VTKRPLRFHWLGDAALTLGCPEPGLAPALSAAIDALIAVGKLPGALESMAALRSVTLYFDPLLADPDSWRGRLSDLVADAAHLPVRRRQWRIPVCCDSEFAPDLAILAARRGVAPDAFLAPLLATTVTVRMIGFLPGFAYMGKLPRRCHAPRLATPRRRVAAGSVAIAGPLCAIYPCTSPGGWNLIGRTPLALFDARRDEQPCLLAPGDQVGWQRIDRGEFDRLAATP
jgi:KipI family sensor histidine kinase inhibitor